MITEDVSALDPLFVERQSYKTFRCRVRTYGPIFRNSILKSFGRTKITTVFRVGLSQSSKSKLISPPMVLTSFPFKITQVVKIGRLTVGSVKCCSKSLLSHQTLLGVGNLIHQRKSLSLQVRLQYLIRTRVVYVSNVKKVSNRIGDEKVLQNQRSERSKLLFFSAFR